MYKTRLKLDGVWPNNEYILQGHSWKKEKEKEKEGKRKRNGRNYIVFHHFLTNFLNAVHTYQVGVTKWWFYDHLESNKGEYAAIELYSTLVSFSLCSSFFSASFSILPSCSENQQGNLTFDHKHETKIISMSLIQERHLILSQLRTSNEVIFMCIRRALPRALPRVYFLSSHT